MDGGVAGIEHHTPSSPNDCGWLGIRLAVKTMGGIRQAREVNDFMVGSYLLYHELPPTLQ
jgi:hypothetical protein